MTLKIICHGGGIRKSPEAEAKQKDDALAIGLSVVEKVNGQAGFIVITRDGEISFAHNCEAMAVASLEEA